MLVELGVREETPKSAPEAPVMAVPDTVLSGTFGDDVDGLGPVNHPDGVL